MLADENIEHSLYLVFPDFIANYTARGEKKYPHVGEDTWLRESFGGCEIVTPAPGKQLHELSFEMDPPFRPLRQGPRGKARGRHGGLGDLDGL